MDIEVAQVFEDAGMGILDTGHMTEYIRANFEDVWEREKSKLYWDGLHFYAYGEGQMYLEEDPMAIEVRSHLPPDVTSLVLFLVQCMRA